MSSFSSHREVRGEPVRSKTLLPEQRLREIDPFSDQPSQTSNAETSRQRRHWNNRSNSDYQPNQHAKTIRVRSVPVFFRNSDQELIRHFRLFVVFRLGRGETLVDRSEFDYYSFLLRTLRDRI